MIDWYFVFTSSLWILGFSIVLAAFSYHHWEAGEKGRRLREQLRLPGWRLWFAVGMSLVCVGFGLAESSRWWERVLWLLLAVSFGWDGWRASLAVRFARGNERAGTIPGEKQRDEQPRE